LSAWTVENVDYMGSDIEQPQLEHGEKPDRTRADDHRIRLRWKAASHAENALFENRALRHAGPRLARA
jgi:hypothetical protein